MHGICTRDAPRAALSSVRLANCPLQEAADTSAAASADEAPGSSSSSLWFTYVLDPSLLRPGADYQLQLDVMCGDSDSSSSSVRVAAASRTTLALRTSAACPGQVRQR